VLDIDYDSPSPRIRVRAPGEGPEGCWVNADLVIGADGVKSVVRKRMLTRSGELDDDGK
jgi:2-polyprenyl-6-methoxyphenol hydroxylase-like FAD-dependent oxidoreductase